MLNKWTGIGRLSRDPELKFLTNGTAVCRFSIAVERDRKSKDGQKETDFINVVVWSKLAELCAEYLSKGKMASIVGPLHMRTYENQDGQKRTIAEINAENVYFLSPKGQGEMSGTIDLDSISTEEDADDTLPF